jgi:hypothetical protein
VPAAPDVGFKANVGAATDETVNIAIPVSPVFDVAVTV